MKISLIKRRTQALADPTSFEEPLLDTLVTVTLDEKNELVSVYQGGGAENSSDGFVKQCVEAARQRHACDFDIVYNGVSG